MKLVLKKWWSCLPLQLSYDDPNVDSSEMAHFSRPGSAYGMRPQMPMKYSDPSMVCLFKGQTFMFIAIIKYTHILFRLRKQNCNTFNDKKLNVCGLKLPHY